jgi:DNA-binding NtrC family response regulator
MRKRILVIDDVRDWREVLREVLEGEYEVKVVDNYEAALEVISKREVELAIVDLRLSPNDETNREGMELLKKLTDYRINAIVLTGYPEEEIKEEAEEKYNAFDFIDKGALAGNLQRLREVVREAFSLLETKAKAKAQAIREARALQSVSFNDELSSWPLRKFRKK